MMWIFWIYRIGLTLGLIACATMLAGLAWVRPIDISESTALLLALAATALALAAAALFRARAACLAILAASVLAAILYGLAASPLAVVPIAIAAAEITVLTWLRPWSREAAPPLARGPGRD